MNLYLDGAHTPESMKVCAEWYSTKITDINSSHTKTILVFNCAATKKPLPLLQTVSHIPFDHVFFTTTETGRSHLLEDKRLDRSPFKQNLSWQEHHQSCWNSLNPTQKNSEICENLPKLLTKLKQFATTHPDHSVKVLVCGSLYLVGALLEILYPDMSDNL